MSDHFWVRTEPRGGIYLEEVERFRERVQIGDRLTCYTGSPTATASEGKVDQESRCTVQKKYRHIALTSKGCFQWSMLTIWNRHLSK